MRRAVLRVMLASTAAFGADGGATRWDGRSAVKLVEGQSVTLTLPSAPSRIATSDPGTCAVEALGPSSLRLTGKRTGVTTVALWYGPVPKGLQVDVVAAPGAVTADAGVPLVSWDGVQRLAVTRGRPFVLQAPAGLERVSPASHRRCAMRPLGNDQLEVRCDEAGAVAVFLWYPQALRRELELDVGDAGLDAGR